MQPQQTIAQSSNARTTSENSLYTVTLPARRLEIDAEVVEEDAFRHVYARFAVKTVARNLPLEKERNVHKRDKTGGGSHKSESLHHEIDYYGKDRCAVL